MLTIKSLFFTIPCFWCSYFSLFRPLAYQGHHLLLSTSPHILLHWVTSLLTQIGWPGKLFKTLFIERISPHYYQGHHQVMSYCCHCLFSAFTDIPINQIWWPFFHALVGHQGLPRGPLVWKNGWGRIAGAKTGVDSISICPTSSCSLLVHSRIAHAQFWLYHFQFKMDCCWAYPILWVGESDMMDSSGCMIVWCPVFCLFHKALGQVCKYILLSVRVSTTISDPLFC